MKLAKPVTSFQDIGGLEAAKKEVQPIIEYLKSFKKFFLLRKKYPHPGHCLLVGPPGTGKTLLANAVAGEAGAGFLPFPVPDFENGVTFRLQPFFQQAKRKSPCVLFFDKIDVVGLARGYSANQKKSEVREHMLNQLLIEIAKLSSASGVVLIATSNRPDRLDKALLRSGRFNWQIGLNRPDQKERAAIFKVHLKNFSCGKDIDAMHLAEMTPGFAGVDIANVCNKAALIAGRNGVRMLSMKDFNGALDKVIGKLERKTKVLSPQEKRQISYSIAGYVIGIGFFPNAQKLVKATIVPRGIGALGYTQFLPAERSFRNTKEMLTKICVLLCGRAAEEITFGRISAGSQNSLDQVTKMAYSLAGLNKTGEQDTDVEVWAIIDEQYEKAKSMLLNHKRELSRIAQALYEKEVLLKSDIEKLIGKRVV